MSSNKLLAAFLALVLSAGSAIAGVLFPLAEQPYSPLFPVYSESYFGMIANNLAIFGTSSPFPSFPVTTWRLWGAGSAPPLWATINTSAGVYTFTTFDSYVNGLIANGITDITYVLGETPDFTASTSPGGCSQGYLTPGASECSPPTCENWATPTCSVWANWISAVTLESKRLGGGTNCAIKHFEIWNEANGLFEWTGTIAQLIALSEIAYPIIHTNCPNSDVWTPSFLPFPTPNPQATQDAPCPATPGNECDGELYALLYLQAGGGAYADALAYHNYLSFVYGAGGTHPVPPELVVMSSQYFNNLAAAYSLPPAISTEMGFYDATYTTAEQADYVVKSTAAMHPYMPKSYWYSYDNGTVGTLYASGALTAAGIAYNIMEGWLIGAVVVSDIARMPSNNILRNTNETGCSAGTPGTLPDHWTARYLDSGNGITTSIGCGTGYIDFKISGTCNSSCVSETDLIMEDGTQGLCNGAGQQVWGTIQQQVSPLSTGNYSSGNLSEVSGIYEYNSSDTRVTHDFGNSAWATTTKQPTVFSYVTQNAACFGLSSHIAFMYPIGVAINQTIRIGYVSLDKGTQWIGNYIAANGKPAILAWDSGSGSTLNGLAPEFGHYEDNTGVTHTISGGSVALTNSPIWITP